MVTDDSVTHFFGGLDFPKDGAVHTAICEGTWTATEDGVRLRVDCEFFPAFWISGRLVDDVFTLDGGRLDDTWTRGVPVSHSSFVCSMEKELTIRYGDVVLVIPPPGTPTGSNVILLGAASQSVLIPTYLSGNARNLFIEQRCH